MGPPVQKSPGAVNLTHCLAQVLKRVKPGERNSKWRGQGDQRESI